MYPRGSNSMHTHKMLSPASVKSLSTSQTFIFRLYTPSQQLHSSADTQCSGYHLSSGQCSFSYQAPTTWNQLLVMLPLSVLSDPSLKTLHFSQAFSSVPLPWDRCVLREDHVSVNWIFVIKICRYYVQKNRWALWTVIIRQKCSHILGLL